MSAVARPELAAVAIADVPERWRALGFTVDDRDRVVLGGVHLTLGGSGSGITGWTLRDLRPGSDLDGLATSVTGEPPSAPVDHRNGAVAVDHLVIVTPDFDRTAAALDVRGLGLRRVRRAGTRRQGFRRLGPAIMEIVEAPEAPAVGFWGITLILRDLTEPFAPLAAHLGEVTDAVQPGRHIATLRRSAGLSAPVAFMDPG
jgi:hypothetical protein